MISSGHQHTGATVAESTRWPLGLGVGGDLALPGWRQGAQTSHQLTGTTEVMLAVPQPGTTTPHSSARPGTSQPAVSQGCSHVRQCQRVTAARPVPTLLLGGDSEPAPSCWIPEQPAGVRGVPCAQSMSCPRHTTQLGQGSALAQ